MALNYVSTSYLKNYINFSKILYYRRQQLKKAWTKSLPEEEK